MPWDARTYLRFGDHRTRPAADLLARVPIDQPRRVYDLGCGPGNSTQLLCERWPESRIIGVDNSPEMLATARQSGLSAEWVEAAIESWSPEAPPDVIFSNAALHWVADHGALIARLISAAAPGGILAVQVPQRVPGQAFADALREIAQLPAWRERFQPLPWGEPGPRPAEYYRWLAPHAARIDIWTTEYLQVLEGADPVLNWTRGTALVPFLERLEPTEQEEFVAAYRERLRAAYLGEADGKTLFPFARLFIVAVRKSD